LQVKELIKVRFWAQNEAEGGKKQKISHIEGNNYVKEPQLGPGDNMAIWSDYLGYRLNH